MVTHTSRWGGCCTPDSGAAVRSASIIRAASKARTPPTKMRKRCTSMSQWLRIQDPTRSPGKVPPEIRNPNQKLSRLSRAKRQRSPGVEVTVKKRLLADTEGDVMPNTLIWNGTSRNAPETPTIEVRKDTTKAAPIGTMAATSIPEVLKYMGSF